MITMMIVIFFVVVIIYFVIYLYMLLIKRKFYENFNKNIPKRSAEEQIHYYDGGISAGNTLPYAILGDNSIFNG